MSSSELFKLLFASEYYATAIAIILLLMSFGLWGVMIAKWRRTVKLGQQNQVFLTQFRKAKEFHELAQIVRRNPNGVLASIAAVALEENAKLPQILSYDNLEHRAGLIEEVLQRSIENWRVADERYLSWLAISANLAPFLGLLGTVWGIMDAFFAIGKQGSAELSVVAPGIAAALVTTVAGLIVAIPAAGAYNLFLSSNGRRETSYYNFGSEILSLFRRSDLQLLEESIQDQRGQA